MTLEKTICHEGVVYYLFDDNTAVVHEYHVDVSAHLEIPKKIEGHTVVGIRAFAFARSEKLRSIVLPETLVDIADYAFYRCLNLYTVTFMAETVSIQDWTFSHCHNLKHIYGNNILAERCSFAGCWTLEIIEAFFVGNLNYGLFHHCNKLQKVFFGKTVKIIGDLFDGVYPESLKIYLESEVDFHEKYQRALDWPTITIVKRGAKEEC